MLRGKCLLSLRLYTTIIVAEMIKVAIDKVFMMKLFAKIKAIMVPIKYFLSLDILKKHLL